MAYDIKLICTKRNLGYYVLMLPESAKRSLSRILSVS